MALIKTVKLFFKSQELFEIFVLIVVSYVFNDISNIISDLLELHGIVTDLFLCKPGF